MAERVPELVPVTILTSVGSLKIKRKGDTTVGRYRTNKPSTEIADPSIVSKNEDKGITIQFLFAAFTAALGSGFQHGYNLGIINEPHDVITAWIENKIKSDHRELNQTLDAETINLEATFICSIIICIYSLGGMFGGLCINFCIKNIGLKRSILLNNFLVFISSLLMGFSKHFNSFNMIILGRFIIGVNCGLGSGLVIIYLSEIPPIGLRGTICSIYQLFITISIMISQFVSIHDTFGTESNWPIIFFLNSGVAVFQLVLFSFCPDSPRYLYQVGKEKKAKEAMTKLRGHAHTELKFPELERQMRIEKRFGKTELFSKEFQTPLMISCVMMLAQQFTGINVIIYYSRSTFSALDLEDLAEQETLIIGIVNVCMTIISVLAVDIVGRRWLLILSFGTMFIDMLVIFVCFFLVQKIKSIPLFYICMVCMTVYVALFAIGAGSIPWFLYTEFFVENTRPMAASVVVSVNWIANFMIGLPFFSLHEAMGSLMFLVFAIMEFFVLLYIIFKIPETRGREVEDIAFQFFQRVHTRTTEETEEYDQDELENNEDDDGVDIEPPIPVLP